MTGVVPYEQRLNEDRRFLREGSMHFEKDAVFRTMQELAGRLDELGIPPDQLQALHEAVEGQVLPAFFRPEREVGGDVAVDRADVGIDVELLLVGLDEGLDRGDAGCRRRASR